MCLLVDTEYLHKGERDMSRLKSILSRDGLSVIKATKKTLEEFGVNKGFENSFFIFDRWKKILIIPFIEGWGIITKGNTYTDNSRYGKTASMGGDNNAKSALSAYKEYKESK